jgi:hypothetical protein
MHYSTTIAATALLALNACSAEQAAPTDTPEAQIEAPAPELAPEVAQTQTTQERIPPETSNPLPTASSQLPQSACGLTLGQSTAGLQDLDNFIGTIEDGDEGYTFTIGQFDCGQDGAIATTVLVSEDQGGEIENIDIIRNISVTGLGYQIAPGVNIGDTLADIKSALPEGTPNCGWLHVPYIEYALENLTIAFNTTDNENMLMTQSCDPVAETVQSTGFHMFRYE